MAILFCNIGWMKHYNGINGDSIKRGGEYNQHSTGHEVCNFSNNAGIFYGYVQPTGQIKIEKLGASKKDDFVSDVTVVWTAGPESGGTAVIGWYKDATVFREAQEIVKPSAIQKKNGVSTFRIKAPSNKAVLLPVEQRELMIPRRVKGGIGQSNVWFANKEESQEIVNRVKLLINGGTFHVFPDVDQTSSILEGNPRLVAHLRRERNLAVVKAKKEAALRATGKLCCEACGFDFKEVYGEIGDGFCEVHHLQPLSKADGVVKTELRDLAIVCSNCHRIIHRTDPMLSISRLVKHLQGKCTQPG
ncbi:TPA: HNH endonuclease [Yersinia enterocolitica]